MEYNSDYLQPSFSEDTLPTENGTLTSPEPSHREVDNNKSNVDQLRRLLGQDVVLLPIFTREKGPRFSGWNSVTIEKMEDATYLTQFTGNVGVLLGQASGNLCTIDIDRDDDLDAFTRLNPKMADTLQTRGSRGRNFWFRVTGEYPSLTKIKKVDGTEWGEWRADGGQTVVSGIHPNGQPYVKVKETSPITISFDEIVWPDDLVLPWVKNDYDILVEECGAPFQYDENNRLTFNEPAIAAKFSKEHLVLYANEEGTFYEYNDSSGLWTLCTDTRIKKMYIDDLQRASVELKDSRILTIRTNQRLTSLSSVLKSYVERNEAFVHSKPFIHCHNGVVDLSCSPPKFRTFSSSYMSRNASPIPYNPKAKCPKFLNELLARALDKDDISLIQRLGGAMLMGRNTAQRFLLLTGTAGGGKSTLISIIESIIGVGNVAELRTEHLGERFELYGYVGKTLLTGKDVASDFLRNDGSSKIKALVGADLLQCERKGGGFLQLRGDFNVTITSNSRMRLKLDEDVEAWERRLVVINYQKPKPKERIPDFANLLIREEGSGILNFFIEGAMQHQEELSVKGDYVLTPKQRDRIAAVMRESDSVRQFIISDVVADAGFDITHAELMTGYYRFCERMAWHAMPHGEASPKLRDLMLEMHHVNRCNSVLREGKNQMGYKGFIVQQENY